MIIQNKSVLLVVVLLLVLEVLEVDEEYSSQQEGLLLPRGTHREVSDEVVGRGVGLLAAACPYVVDLPDYFLLWVCDLELHLLARTTRAFTEEPALATFAIDFIHREVICIKYIESQAAALPRISHLSKVHI